MVNNIYGKQQVQQAVQSNVKETFEQPRFLEMGSKLLEAKEKSLNESAYNQLSMNWKQTVNDNKRLYPNDPISLQKELNNTFISLYNKMPKTMQADFYKQAQNDIISATNSAFENKDKIDNENAKLSQLDLSKQLKDELPELYKNYFSSEINGLNIDEALGSLNGQKEFLSNLSKNTNSKGISLLTAQQQMQLLNDSNERITGFKDVLTDSLLNDSTGVSLDNAIDKLNDENWRNKVGITEVEYQKLLPFAESLYRKEHSKKLLTLFKDPTEETIEKYDPRFMTQEQKDLLKSALFHKEEMKKQKKAEKGTKTKNKSNEELVIEEQPDVATYRQIGEERTKNTNMSRLQEYNSNLEALCEANLDLDNPDMILANGLSLAKQINSIYYDKEISRKDANNFIEKAKACMFDDKKREVLHLYKNQTENSYANQVLLKPEMGNLSYEQTAIIRNYQDAISADPYNLSKATALNHKMNYELLRNEFGVSKEQFDNNKKNMQNTYLKYKGNNYKINSYDYTGILLEVED